MLRGESDVSLLSDPYTLFQYHEIAREPLGRRGIYGGLTEASLELGRDRVQSRCHVRHVSSVDVNGPPFESQQFQAGRAERYVQDWNAHAPKPSGLSTFELARFMPYTFRAFGKRAMTSSRVAVMRGSETPATVSRSASRSARATNDTHS